MACSPASAPLTGSAPLGWGPKEPWEEEWDQLVIAAKREGKLVMAGPRGDDTRETLTEPYLALEDPLLELLPPPLRLVSRGADCGRRGEIP